MHRGDIDIKEYIVVLAVFALIVRNEDTIFNKALVIPSLNQIKIVVYIQLVVGILVGIRRIRYYSCEGTGCLYLIIIVPRRSRGDEIAACIYYKVHDRNYEGGIFSFFAFFILAFSKKGYTPYIVHFIFKGITCKCLNILVGNYLKEDKYGKKRK